MPIAASPPENTATETRERRGGYQPGETPRGIAHQPSASALKGRTGPAPLQGAKQSVVAGTQGVALG
ncbi:MAG: hypothetical protein ABSA96_07945 [Candidatus Acidiferrales bacterium]